MLVLSERSVHVEYGYKLLSMCNSSQDNYSYSSKRVNIPEM